MTYTKVDYDKKATVKVRAMTMHLDKVQEHMDKMYDLIRESNPDGKIYRADGNYSDQDKRTSAAMWHAHEVCKYIAAAKYHMNKENEA